MSNYSSEGSHPTVTVLKRRMSEIISHFNYVMDGYNQNFSVDICTDGYIHLVRCIYSLINSFPKIDVLDSLCHSDEPIWKAFLPLEFALQRIYSEISIQEKGGVSK